MKKVIKRVFILFFVVVSFISVSGIILDYVNQSQETAKVVSEKVLVPGGQSVGIRMNIKGVLVVGLE